MSELAAALDRLAQLAAAGSGVADEPAGKALLAGLGVAVPPGRVVGDSDAAALAAEALGGPVAVKRAACDLPHKSDVGAVAGPLHSGGEVRSAAARMLEAGDPLLVERWVQGGIDCFVGLALDTPFGAVVSFGLGGIWVEVMRDVGHRLAPVTEAEALTMVHALRGAPLLLGGRGREPVDLVALCATISAISRLALQPRASRVLSALDVNPLRVLPEAAPIALDATAVLARAAPAPLATAPATTAIA